MKFNINIPEELLDAVRMAAKKDYTTVSEWIRSALLKKLKEK